MIVNEERKGALYNTINGEVTELSIRSLDLSCEAIAMGDPQDDDVIVVVDGDDWLTPTQVNARFDTS